jgi:hypothetical protein
MCLGSAKTIYKNIIFVNRVSTSTIIDEKAEYKGNSMHLFVNPVLAIFSYVS